MNLYHVQDADRPMYVVAGNWQHALARWKRQIREENDGEVGDEPQGVTLVCGSNELLLPAVLGECVQCDGKGEIDYGPVAGTCARCGGGGSEVGP